MDVRINGLELVTKNKLDSDKDSLQPAPRD